MPHIGPQPPVRRARAFVQAELFAILTLVVLAAAILTVAGGERRGAARTAGSMANLQRFASGITSFAADHEDRILSFTWTPGPHTDRTGYVFPVANTAVDAASDQAVAIMRWHADREDITFIRAWAPHFVYTHLALVEYLDHRLPADFAVSPHDVARLGWQRAVRGASGNQAAEGYFALTSRPPGTSNSDKRWAYSSSYEFVPASFSPDARRLLPNGTFIPTTGQDPMGHRYFQVGNSQTPFGQRRVSEIVYPGQKVVVFETIPAGAGGSVGYFYASSPNPMPMLFGDGSVQARIASQANAGFFPNTPLSDARTRINYLPEPAWEPPTTTGGLGQFVFGHMRWTRSGLRGRDFDGPEIPWVD